MSLQAALQFWKEFNVHEFQRELDATATEIARRQDESDVSRKKLIELSKDFKKNSTEEFRRKVSPLLKSFQAEVDALSRRGQAAESSFLGTYRKMIQIADPIPVLEQAVVTQERLQAAKNSEIENEKLKQTLLEYSTELAEARNQEVTIMRLQEQLREMEGNLEARTSARAGEKEAEVMRAYKEKERQLQEATSEAVSKLRQAETKASTMQTALEATQSELFELKNRYDEYSTARSAEVEILMTDLERANQRASAAAKEIERLSQPQSEGFAKSSQEKVASERVELELELQARDKEISRLSEDAQRLQSSLSRLREASSVQVASLEQQLVEKTEAVRVLEDQLAGQGDYEELKRELSVIKMIEFSSSASNSAVAQESSSSEASGPSKPLEVLLLEKNRALQNENTSLKLELSELRDHFSSLQQQHSGALQTLQDQKDLIGQLESDLMQVQPYLPVRTEGEGQASPSSAELLSEVLRTTPSEKSGAGDAVGSSSLLSIVTSQRERFKQRNAELEAECRQQRQTVTVLEREVDSLRGDNVKLYEKIKFLQSYPGTRKSVDDKDAMSRYSSHYEAHLDPFAAFSAKEKQRKYAQLSGPDKATLVMMLFKLANAVVCERDTYAECAKRFTEHMQLFHPEHAKEILDSFAAADRPG